MVSNDLFRDLKDEDEAFKEAIKDSFNLILFQIDKDGNFDTFMNNDATQHDPRGKHLFSF